MSQHRVMGITLHSSHLYTHIAHIAAVKPLPSFSDPRWHGSSDYKTMLVRASQRHQSPTRYPSSNTSWQKQKRHIATHAKHDARWNTDGEESSPFTYPAHDNAAGTTIPELDAKMEKVQNRKENVPQTTLSSSHEMLSLPEYHGQSPFPTLHDPSLRNIMIVPRFVNRPPHSRDHWWGSDYRQRIHHIWQRRNLRLQSPYRFHYRHGPAVRLSQRQVPHGSLYSYQRC